MLGAAARHEAEHKAERRKVNGGRAPRQAMFRVEECVRTATPTTASPSSTKRRR
jgi:hypothetical protein